MPWLKRNLWLVVGAAVALVLMGLAGYFLYSQIQRKDAVAQKLSDQRSELQRLQTRKAFPNEANIQAARQEISQLTNFEAKIEGRFTPVPIPPELATNFGAQAFSQFLEDSIYRMKHEADQYGVTLPENYDFTFGQQRQAMSFTPSSLPLLASEVAEVRSILKIVFNAKVNELVRVRRAPVSDDDNGEDVLSQKITTNTVTGAILTPYEITFRSFSSELADIMNGLASAPHCYVVKAVTVRAANALSATNLYQSSSEPMGMSAEMAKRYGLMPSAGQNQRGADESMQQRYGNAYPGGGGGAPADRYNRGGPGRYNPGGYSRYGGGGYLRRYGLRGAPGAGANPYASQRPSGPRVVLQEHPLRITLLLQVVKIPPPSPPSSVATVGQPSAPPVP